MLTGLLLSTNKFAKDMNVNIIIAKNIEFIIVGRKFCLPATKSIPKRVAIKMLNNITATLHNTEWRLKPKQRENTKLENMNDKQSKP